MHPDVVWPGPVPDRRAHLQHDLSGTVHAAEPVRRATPTAWDFRNVDIYGQGTYDLWLADVGPGQVGQLTDFTVQNTYDRDPTSPRTIAQRAAAG